MTENNVANKIKISQNIFFLNFIVFFKARVLSIPKKLLHAVRNKIKKELWQLVKKQKSYSKSQNVKKCPKTQNF